MSAGRVDGSRFASLSNLGGSDDQALPRSDDALVRGDIVKQTETCLENVKAAVEAAGSSLDKVVKVTIYAANSAYYSTINKVYARYFSTDPPARTFVTVGSWPMEFDVEIECVALA